MTATITHAIRSLLGPMRLPFLLLPPVCVFLGYGTAIWRTGEASWLYAILALIGGLSAHISVNALNEYSDFKSGLDFKTNRTPFSGGSGTLPAQPEKAGWAFWTGWVAFTLTALIGFFFVYVWGWALLPLGLMGLFLLIAYTPWLTRTPWLCLIAPGLGFGVFMVMGTDFVLTGSYSWNAFIASLVPMFLVSNLLLLNQFPDAEADRTIGRKHLPIFAGRFLSAVVYDTFLLFAYLSILSGVLTGYLPGLTLLGLGTLVLSIPTGIGVIRYYEDREKLLPYMGLNVAINLLTPILVGIGFLFG